LFKFQNGLPPKTLFFEFNITVKSAKKEISRFFDLKNPKFIINAQQPNDNNLLCSSLENEINSKNAYDKKINDLNKKIKNMSKIKDNLKLDEKKNKSIITSQRRTAK